MEDRISIRQWLENFRAGKYASADRETQCDAGWYDWFCRDDTLAIRLYKLAPKVEQIAKSYKVDIDKQHVFFKNNCPMYGKLYDDFRICDMETRNVIFTVIPRTGFASAPNRERAEVWGEDPNFGDFDKLIQGTWNDVKKFFGV
jgi:thiol-disulfide isomerase/thioredoxin